MSGVLCGTLRQLYLKRLLTLRLNGLLRRRLLSLRVYGCVRCTMFNDSYDLQVPRSFLRTYIRGVEAEYMSTPTYMSPRQFFCLRLHARPTRFFPTPSIKHQASLIYLRRNQLSILFVHLFAPRLLSNSRNENKYDFGDEQKINNKTDVTNNLFTHPTTAMSVSTLAGRAVGQGEGRYAKKGQAAF